MIDIWLDMKQQRLDFFFISHHFLPMSLIDDTYRVQIFSLKGAYVMHTCIIHTWASLMKALLIANFIEYETNVEVICIYTFTEICVWNELIELYCIL